MSDYFVWSISLASTKDKQEHAARKTKQNRKKEKKNKQMHFFFENQYDVKFLYKNMCKCILSSNETVQYEDYFYCSRDSLLMRKKNEI